MRWIVRSIAFAAISAVICSTSARAQEATPVGIVPLAGDCQREPSSIEVLQSFVATPVVASAATPGAVMPEGEPADDATTQEINGAVYEFIACANTGDSLRVLSFYSPAAIVRLFSDAGIAPELFGFLATPEAIAPGEETVLYEIGPVALLADGRAVVSVIGDDLSEPGPPSAVVLYWIQDGGVWLVDDVSSSEADATPTP